MHTQQPARSLMPRHRTLLSIVAAAALAGIAESGSAVAQTTASPVEIEACTTVYASSAEQVYAMGMQTATGVAITYVNRASVAISDVTFAIGDEPRSFEVIDRGSFAPGTLIRHVFAIGMLPAGGCRVKAVAFVGGTAFAATSRTPVPRR